MFSRFCTRAIRKQAPSQLFQKKYPRAILRTDPNIIITGTPGVGKTTHCQELAAKTGLYYLDINEVVKKHNIGEALDDLDDPNLQIVDEDRLLDYHAYDLFLRKQIDLVYVIRYDNKILYDRLKARNYSEKKLEENINYEIIEVLLNEAREAYNKEIVVELRSKSTEDVDANIERIETKDRDAKAAGADETRDEDNLLFLHG
ncbi:P-loop containing nucleoside triphosphate hydrolase protein [Dissoconium aciculare CBS 342.82]|uniref:Adenylate kinase isoenzyme 6 homolog n=1 Tax=Dissoconium aciculare CBS 342.82 TaxID=1314786 RepID=A0A6J3LQ09_9PEZI|nr:P-loop containing nucleoside triphosphate hydrolase protein [Dissoconium aciculare CBS 342.82]KAF1817738.1 P-loop containing nucleoside triphosphate hydrolase protein [Dissoconium aciculare CBS 342.82]